MLTRLRSSVWVRGGIVLVVLGFVGYALYARWGEADAALRSLPLWLLPTALAAAMAGLYGQMLAWRALLNGLGSALPAAAAARVMFPAQLGKYLPGSVWAIAAQVELARDRGVPRPRGAAATLLAVAVTLTVNLAVAAVMLPLASPGAARQWWWALAAAPLLLSLLHPRPVTAAIRLAQRLARRASGPASSELDRVSLRGMAAAVGWSAAAWIPLGLHAWLLAYGAGAAGPWAFAAAAGTYALAWTLGVLAVFTPAGWGVREAVLVAGLAPVLDPGSALVVAVLSRLVVTASDLAWAGIAVAAVPRTPPPRSLGSRRDGG